MDFSIKYALLAAVVAVLTVPALARSGAPAERTQANRDIWVQPGEKTGDLTCFNCSIHVRGEVAGDVAAMHGNVTVESQGQVAGDVASFFGDVLVENDAHVTGDVAAMGGRIRRDPRGSIAGDQAAFARFWILPITLVPLVLLGLIIALIVWLVQRRRQAIPRTA